MDHFLDKIKYITIIIKDGLYTRLILIRAMFINGETNLTDINIIKVNVNELQIKKEP